MSLSKNVAVNKPTTCSSIYYGSGPNRMVDGDVNPNFFAGHCFHGYDDSGGPNWAVVDLTDVYFVDYVDLYSRECCPERLDYFIIGLTSVNYFGPGSNVIRGDYPLCGQYKYKGAVNAKLTLKCNANLLSPYRYVIAQQPTSGPGSLTICELEVYPAINFNFKIWRRYANLRLAGYTFLVTHASHVAECFFNCAPGLCDSVNFKPDGSLCELNSHLKGYDQTSLNVSPDWSFLEVQYV
ncbi:hypothetical protein HELRODRAFT_176919 [Helobdella robusta]|uniref:Fucolectin tachylectin-4 pentraxin-1 domain-containing protein n=1 Tax=Helobdella robusta TaxID=6412 RepID=T1FB18_HELRO|nr:hypothetical protein HELRODRAFT_176919 [Helobdella robusta]ESN98445.1 hypothetical protein HELRODRAFT_176919 [Helobdella robusta]